jgi:hypothetical protein
VIALAMDITGQTFGKNEVIDYSHTDKNGKSVWNCICHGCKSMLKVHGHNLVYNKSKSCSACAAKEREEKRKVDVKLQNKGQKHIETYHNAGSIIDSNLHLFRNPLRDMYQAYVLKTRGNAQCAFKDIVKIFKNLEMGVHEHV